MSTSTGGAPSLQITQMFLDTRSFLRQRLENAEAPSAFFLRFATPLIGIRSAAVLLRGMIAGEALVGFVLALGNFVLQMGAWLAVSFTLPVVVKQFGSRMEDRTGFAVTSYVSAPLWIAGALYIVPEEPPLTFFWSRALVTFFAGFGLYVGYRSFEILEVKSRSAVLGAMVAVYVVAYLFLFGLVGLSSNLFLFLF
ncbi:MAG: hypothetical protein AAFX94_08725 [Myxococcota bacterium]